MMTSIPLLFCLLLSITAPLRAQNILLPNAYAHNDYRHKHPLNDALNNGFSYVEADIYLRGDQLIVAHILPGLKAKKRTLEELYLKPLQQHINNSYSQQQTPVSVTLMIDIKSGAEPTFHALSLLLEKYRDMLSDYSNGAVNLREVTIIITGHRPYNVIKSKQNRLVFMDEDLHKTGEDSAANTYPIASCKYSSILKWRGKGILNDQEKQVLKNYVEKAHQCGRKVRLWASPENRNVWEQLLNCHVDLINTDKLTRLKNFLLHKKNTDETEKQLASITAIADRPLNQ